MKSAGSDAGRLFVYNVYTNLKVYHFLIKKCTALHRIIAPYVKLAEFLKNLQYSHIYFYPMDHKSNP